MSSSWDLDRLYQWATMTPVNLLASLILAAIGLVVLFALMVAGGWFIGSVIEQIPSEGPAGRRAVRERPVQGWWVWIAIGGMFLLGMMLFFHFIGWMEKRP